MNRLFAVITGIASLNACSSAPTSRIEPAYVDTAEVTRVEPLYQAVQVVRPVKKCWTESVPHTTRRANGYAGTVAGGIIGGVIGNRIARKRDRLPLSVAGALVGAGIGRHLSRRAYAPATSWRDVQRCTTIERYVERQKVVGYRVEYRYEGRIFTTQTNRHPGRYMRIRVDMDPVGRT